MDSPLHSDKEEEGSEKTNHSQEDTQTILTQDFRFTQSQDQIDMSKYSELEHPYPSLSQEDLRRHPGHLNAYGSYIVYSQELSPVQSPTRDIKISQSNGDTPPLRANSLYSGLIHPLGRQYSLENQTTPEIIVDMPLTQELQLTRGGTEIIENVEMPPNPNIMKKEEDSTKQPVITKAKTFLATRLTPGKKKKPNIEIKKVNKKQRTARQLKMKKREQIHFRL